MCLLCVFSSPPWEFLGLYTVIYECQWPPFRCPGLRLSGGLFSNLWGMPFGTRPSSRLAGGSLAPVLVFLGCPWRRGCRSRAHLVVGDVVPARLRPVPEVYPGLKKQEGVLVFISLTLPPPGSPAPQLSACRALFAFLGV